MQARPAIDAASRQTVIARGPFADIITLLGVRARAYRSRDTLPIANNLGTRADAFAVEGVVDETIGTVETAWISQLTFRLCVWRIYTVLCIGRRGDLIRSMYVSQHNPIHDS